MLLWCSLYRHLCSGAPTSELFTEYGASPSLYAEFAVSDTVADSGWPAHAYHCSPCHSEGAPAPARPSEREHKKTLKRQRSTVQPMANRKPSSNCLMLDVSPQTLQLIDKKKGKKIAQVFLLFSLSHLKDSGDKQPQGVCCMIIFHFLIKIITNQLWKPSLTMVLDGQTQYKCGLLFSVPIRYHSSH